jgi:hypothetical protein
MKYEKPELTALPNPVESIRGNGKPLGDCCDASKTNTPHAYEADE